MNLRISFNISYLTVLVCRCRVVLHLAVGPKRGRGGHQGADEQDGEVQKSQPSRKMHFFKNCLFDGRKSFSLVSV